MNASAQPSVTNILGTGQSGSVDVFVATGVNVVGLQARGLVGIVNIWQLVDDSQTSVWVPVDDDQNPTWAPVNDIQTPTWTNVPN